MMLLRQWLFGLVAAGVGAVLLPVPTVQAQSSGDGFLFQQPAASLALRGGFQHAAASGELFAFTAEQLTVGRGDFGGPLVGADLSVRLGPRLDLVLGAAYSGTQLESEFRDWVDQDDLPIQQTTRFDRVPLTAGVRAYLTPRGRTVGTFAWVPARYAPYVGAGAGAMWYRFHQQGDFVDFQTLDIFSDELATQGWTPTANGVAGVEVALTPRLALTGEGRYTWASAQPRDAFDQFDRIDLAGFAASIGIQVRF